MKGMSERRYAAHAGISRGAVQKARAAGRLALFQDGSIDAAGSDARRARTTDPGKQRVRPGRSAGRRPVAGAAVGSVRETLHEQGLSSGPRITYVEARTAHEIAKAHLARLKLQERKGELVDRAQAAAHVFRLARQERDAWLTWPARIAALMAAELGLEPHAMQTALESHVRAHLFELAEIKPDLR